MTEQQNLNQNVSDSSVSSSANANMQEDMMSRSYAENLIRERGDQREKKGYERGYQEALNKFQQQVPQAESKVNQSSGYEDLRKDLSDLRSQMEKKETEAVEKLKQEQQMAYYTNVGNQIAPKIQEARKKHEDFDEVVNQESLKDCYQLIELANEVDNGGDVLYEYMKNPEKLGNLWAIPSAAKMREAIRNTSNMLKNNEKSANKPVPRSPLSQPTPSNVRSNGKQADDVSRWKNHRW